MTASSEARIESGAKSLTARGDRRREAMLRAATEVFFEKGYEKTTLSDIVGRAGGSKSFIYEQFGDKAGLFRAMMADSCEAILRPLTDNLLTARDPREAVARFADYLASVTAVEMTGAERSRLVIAFIAMIRGQLIERLAAGSRFVPVPAETDAIIDLAVAWLLGRFGLA